MTQGMPVRYNIKVLVLVLKCRKEELSFHWGWVGRSRELLVGVLQIPTHSGVEMR